MKIQWDPPVISTANVRGARPHNEDRCSVRRMGPLTLLTVCDGHGGHRCAAFAKQWFPDEVVKLLDSGTTEIAQVLSKALAKTVEAWDMLCFDGKKAPTTGKELEQMKKQGCLDGGLISGTTLVSCLIDAQDNEMYTISLGDSRADWQFGQTRDQKIDKDRINHLKARFPNLRISRGRVNGNLAIDSAIGDNGGDLAGVINRIPYSPTMPIQLISKNPRNEEKDPGETSADIDASLKRKRKSEDEKSSKLPSSQGVQFKLILASDGLWDTVVEQEPVYGDQPVVKLTSRHSLFAKSSAKEMIPNGLPADNVTIIYFSLSGKMSC